jgi:hypothetical protein
MGVLDHANQDRVRLDKDHGPAEVTDLQSSRARAHMANSATSAHHYPTEILQREPNPRKVQKKMTFRMQLVDAVSSFSAANDDGVSPLP